MSLTGSLSNALSGLTAASRAAEMVSSNLANAMTEGYGRRTLNVAPSTIGAAGGVQVVGITRHVDPSILGDRRLADSDVQHGETMDRFQARLEGLAGTPEDEMSLPARLANFEHSLVLAASRPDPERAGCAGLPNLDEIAQTLNTASDGIQKLRTEADQAIKRDVEQTNMLLGQARNLNLQISEAVNQGKDHAALQDHRQLVIDQISEIVPVREVPRDLGAVALFTTGGAILLDGTAAILAFEATNVIMPHMTEDAGHLSGLTINDIAVRTDSKMSPMRGGRLGANFQIRDETAIAAQSQVDAIARDLIERFQDPSVDPTLAASDPGLFADGASVFDASDEVGVAGRISLNTLVDADTGDVWRLRDGFGSAVPGDVGNATQLHAFSSALQQTRIPMSGSFGPVARSASELTARFLTQLGNDREISQQTLSFAATRQSSLMVMELENGVDSDHEIQQLMLVEQSFAANARIIEAVDEMMQQLLRI